ncbi:MAG: cytochrome-c peroxidase [Bacteroidia bacterium]|nr:cytochrome-c peroxidase [Bacteroidia bacterium]
MKRVIYLVLLCMVALPFMFRAESQAGEHTKRRLPRTAAELGKMLFSEPLLSLDRSISCASCHKPEFAFADTMAFSLGVNGQRSTRNTPSAMNLAGHFPFFYDGRAATLEEQALGPIANPVEMALPVDSAVERLNRDAFYRKAFQKIFHSPATAQNLGTALAAFERTLNTNAPWDKYMNGGDSLAVSEAVLRGREIFNNKAKCFDCHKGVDFTTDEFRNIGLYNGKNLNDRGRFDITGDSADLGKFKTPGLRNVSVTGPYMHNGMFATLREVIDYYNDPQQFVPDAVNTDSLIQPLFLNERQKTDLEAFLRSLTHEQFVHRR